MRGGARRGARSPSIACSCGSTSGFGVGFGSCLEGWIECRRLWVFWVLTWSFERAGEDGWVGLGRAWRRVKGRQMGCECRGSLREFGGRDVWGFVLEL